MTILIGLVAAITPLAGQSTAADDRRVTVVRSSDLDLSRPADVRQLRLRVEAAVSSVCTIGGRSLKELTWQRTCRAETVAQARPAVERAIAAASSPSRTQITAR